MTTGTRLAFTAVSVIAALAGGTCARPTSPTANDGGGVGIAVANEGWVHIAEGSPTSFRSNPPASGSHYPVWLRYEIFTTTISRGYWVHNLEHGAIVFLYRPDAPASVLTALIDAFRSLPADPKCGHPRALLTSDPAMPRRIAVVAADFLLTSDSVDVGAIREFVLAHRDRAPESICDGGSRP